MNRKFNLTTFLYEQAESTADPGLAGVISSLGDISKKVGEIEKTGAENKKNLANALKLFGKSPEKPTNSNSATGPTTAVGAKGAKPAGDKTPTSSGPGNSNAPGDGKAIEDLTTTVDNIEKQVTALSNPLDKKMQEDLGF